MHFFENMFVLPTRPHNSATFCNLNDFVYLTVFEIPIVDIVKVTSLYSVIIAIFVVQLLLKYNFKVKGACNFQNLCFHVIHNHHSKVSFHLACDIPAKLYFVGEHFFIVSTFWLMVMIIEII